MKSTVNIVVFILTLFLVPLPLFAAGGQPLLLFYSNDVHGETAPCG